MHRTVEKSCGVFAVLIYRFENFQKYLPSLYKRGRFDCLATDENPRFYRGKKNALVKTKSGELKASHEK